MSQQPTPAKCRLFVIKITLPKIKNSRTGVFDLMSNNYLRKDCARSLWQSLQSSLSNRAGSGSKGNSVISLPHFEQFQLPLYIFLGAKSLPPLLPPLLLSYAI
ncbi:MAG: hypothetical protein A2918_01090 [Candidatus Yanofskybacteria bacterium RIFCSPLOWO2_01_FULL_42_49]|uniref:Uncharacterized protein n=1 Tax=Candidatus Yanofskybacteria bacterium RIFCSPLOWO2_01_FULL_42_49 TaxID=1802694 RepID=A0A1F8GDZ2_9BACT|nr:MAG: hypothetical protein A2918_01090 [Candidatus Yanofskybacteria bacterium RIFCSPLOWO2_01_FULL_42_49]